MTVKSLRHRLSSAVVDGGDSTLVRPSNWNDDHDLWLGMRTVSATSDVISNTDHLTFVRFTNAAAVAVSIAAPSGSNMPTGWVTRLKNVNSSALTLTGTGCTINGASSIVLAQGESLQLFSDGTTDYGGVVGLSPNSPSIKSIAPDIKLLNTLVASNQQYLTDTTSITSAYDSYEFEFLNLVPAAAATLYMQLFSAASGWISGNNAMSFCCWGTGNAASNQMAVDSSNGYLILSGAANSYQVAASPNGGVCGMVVLHGPNSGSRKYISGLTASVPGGGTAGILISDVGAYSTADPVTAVRFTFINTAGTSQNITTGTVRVYGRKTS
jgi:hypothetical protein